jgi:hypothetical protein
MCVYSLSYAAWRAHTPYYIIICGLSDFILQSHDFLKKCTECKMCVLIFSTFVWFWEELSEVLPLMYVRLRVKYPLFLPYFNATWILFTDFRKKYSGKIWWKSVQWERVVPRRWTDMTTMSLIAVLRTRVKPEFCSQSTVCFVWFTQ